MRGEGVVRERDGSEGMRLKRGEERRERRWRFY